MNVTTHEEKKESEQTKTGVNKAGEGRREVTDFGEGLCYPFAVVQGAT